MSSPRRLRLAEPPAVEPDYEAFTRGPRHLPGASFVVCSLDADELAFSFAATLAAELDGLGLRPRCLVTAFSRVPAPTGPAFERLARACGSSRCVGVFEPVDLAALDAERGEGGPLLLIGAPALLGVSGALGVLLGEAPLGRPSRLALILRARAILSLPTPREEVARGLARGWCSRTATC
jgi:hypothetical protein